MKKFLMLFLLLLAACGPVTPIAVDTAPTSVATDVAPLATALPTAGSEVLPTPVSGDVYPAAVLAAQAHLSAQLNLPAQQIWVTNVTSRDWPDACLGIAAAGQMCAAVITPGYVIIFAVGAVQYTYHTDLEGKNLHQVTERQVPLGNRPDPMLLEWGGADCARLLVYGTAVLYGKCDGALAALLGLTEVENEPLKSWLKSFAPFDAETPAGKLKFSGLGNTGPDDRKSIATPTEQRMIAEWARLQYQLDESGRARAGAAWGLAFGYSRQGGIAGFCDEVAVYLDGHALISSCKGRNVTLYLTGSEMQQIYAWLDDLRPIDYSQTDAAAADGMKITLSMPGLGQKTADDATQSAILTYVSELTAQAAAIQQASPDVPEAELALVNYFHALHGGDFAQAAQLYGGPRELLQIWNPDIKNDLPAMLKNACKNNGLVCMLPRSVRYQGQDERGGFLFSIEFNNADGSLFIQGPCCGETNGISFTRFYFTVMSSGNGWQVLELPPYVP